MGTLVVYMCDLSPKFSTHNDKLGLALKQLRVGNTEEGVGTEKSRGHRKYQELQGPGSFGWASPSPNCSLDGSKWSLKSSVQGLQIRSPTARLWY